MIHSTPNPSQHQDNSSDVRSELTVHIPGSAKHFVSADVLLSHLRLALKTTTLSGGRHMITVAHDGGVCVDGETVYTPKTLAGKVGAA